jgi:hypothetical protein
VPKFIHSLALPASRDQISSQFIYSLCTLKGDITIIMAKANSCILVASNDDLLDESSTASLAGSDFTRQQQVDISGQDSVGVSRWKRMVIVMLLLTAALVITTTYIFLSREETDEFEKSVRFSMFGIQQSIYRGDTTKTR